MNFSEFFHMGGYAVYVWPAYGLTFVALVVNLVIPIMQRRQLIGKISKKLQRANKAL